MDLQIFFRDRIFKISYLGVNKNFSDKMFSGKLDKSLTYEKTQMRFCCKTIILKRFKLELLDLDRNVTARKN